MVRYFHNLSLMCKEENNMSTRKGKKETSHKMENSIIDLISMDNRSTGLVRTKIICLIDCPKCHAKLRLQEHIYDDSTVKGELLVMEDEK